MEMVKKYFYKTVFWIINTIQRIKNYVFWGEFEKKHILFQKEGSQIRLIIRDHDDFIEDIQKKIDSFKKKKNEDAYIRFALEQALEGCVYILISKGEKFIQFWTGKGRLDFDFPINKVNKNKKFYYQVIGLLADMDFVRDSFVPSSMPTFFRLQENHTYKVDQGRNLTTITGYFKKMVEPATIFTMKMFGEIYKEKKAKLEIKVG